jgi:hypothetical protein
VELKWPRGALGGGGGGLTRREGDKAWRVQHDKHGKFQCLFLVLVIFN